MSSHLLWKSSIDCRANHTYPGDTFSLELEVRPIIYGCSSMEQPSESSLTPSQMHLRGQCTPRSLRFDNNTPLICRSERVGSEDERHTLRSAGLLRCHIEATAPRVTWTQEKLVTVLSFYHANCDAMYRWLVSDASQIGYVGCSQLGPGLPGTSLWDSNLPRMPIRKLLLLPA